MEYKRKWRLTNELICKPPKYKGIPQYRIKYSHAQEMADDIEIPEDGERLFSIMSGRFIFGDLIEALFVKHNWHTKKLKIATLSISQDNIDSLQNLLDGGYVDSIELIISDYFYSHERHNLGLMKYLYENLDNGRLSVSVAGIHTKITQFIINENQRIVMHGSANLRSCDSIEQLVIENCQELYDFNCTWMDQITTDYATIRKPMRGNTLWQAVKAVEKVSGKTKRKHRLKNENQKGILD